MKEFKELKNLRINIHKLFYKCTKLKHGITPTPAIWRKYIESVFHDLEGVDVFYDDARITAPDFQAHFSIIRKFFDRCRQHGLRINKDKSKCFKNEIELLGYKINPQGLLKQMKRLLKSRMLKFLKMSFMRLFNSYCIFSNKLATLAYPLHTLTKGYSHEYL